jgi:hypothetical protein
MCAGSERVLAAAIPHFVAMRLPPDLDYVEIGITGKALVRRKPTRSNKVSD